MIKSGIWNYYGEIVVYESEGKYYLSLEDWSGEERKEVSKEFYETFKNEFKD